ncbi:hypothetical protein BLGI_438 [Brevibacillus laterosporus GI-9]|nr:hypothetical protein BLGI_438 [Brevibacillus laterosporus GI-9]
MNRQRTKKTKNKRLIEKLSCPKKAAFFMKNSFKALELHLIYFLK